MHNEVCDPILPSVFFCFGVILFVLVAVLTQKIDDIFVIYYATAHRYAEGLKKEGRATIWLLFSSPEPKARVSYCHSAPSVVRPSVRPSSSVVVVRKLSHFRLLLQNRLMDFDETWYAWSTHGPLQVLLFFGQIRPGADPGRGKNRSRGVPFFKKLLLQTGRLQRQTECIAMT